MLENNLVRQTTRDARICFPKVHLPLRKGYISVEELERDLTSRVSFNLFSIKAIFFMKRQDHKLPAAHHNLGS
jgi:hypothetical protein